MKIAVIGSGISGLSAAFYLSKKYKVDLFEQNGHFGGHSYTYDIKKNNKTIPVDLGFIVFNELTYPNLIKFFNELDVPFEKSDMSFSVSIQDSNIEYGGSGLKAIFANKLNVFNLNFLRMIKEIISFYQTAPFLLKKNLNKETLGSYLDKSNLSKYFIEYHIIPMVAAIWSMPFEKAKDMPLKLFLNFFINHGLFKLKNRPQWYTVTNRSRAYVKKVLSKISGEVFKHYKVTEINRSEGNVRINIGGEYLDYDQVILASHADQSLEILKDSSEEEKRILSKFKYVSNVAILHTDERLMPKRKVAWSSWNSISQGNQTCVTYWLNNLQNLKCDNNFFLTLNPIYKIHNSDIIKKINFTHPYFNLETLKLQKDLYLLQGKKRTWFCGSYFGYGFHEDGLKSTISLIENFKI
ncbi:MAG: flavin-containing amine oxidoreductase [Pelagibacterales bacterium MED-G40]|nr:MAG: flavin-containing amine oxidoreductase [Pelagibacterales bacterium MED-G40]|tara:strand:- start:1009 stop:2235 length:1227 start_codon:yes stop_codon:yes gene_type:complete